MESAAEAAVLNPQAAFKHSLAGSFSREIPMPPRALRIRLPLLLAVAAAAPAFAQPESRPPSVCIGSPSDVSWTAQNDHTILARANGRSYLVTTSKCPRLADPLTHIVVEATAGGPICNPHDVRLYVSGPDRIPTPCMIQDIKPSEPAAKRP
jgi:hypothetical protein